MERPCEVGAGRGASPGGAVERLPTHGAFRCRPQAVVSPGAPSRPICLCRGCFVAEELLVQMSALPPRETDHFRTTLTAGSRPPLRAQEARVVVVVEKVAAIGT